MMQQAINGMNNEAAFALAVGQEREALNGLTGLLSTCSIPTCATLATNMLTCQTKMAHSSTTELLSPLFLTPTLLMNSILSVALSTTVDSSWPPWSGRHIGHDSNSRLQHGTRIPSTGAVNKENSLSMGLDLQGDKLPPPQHILQTKYTLQISERFSTSFTSISTADYHRPTGIVWWSLK